MNRTSESDASFKEKAEQLEEENKKLQKKIERLKKTMEITSKHGDILAGELEEKVEASIKEFESYIRVIGETLPVPIKISSISGKKIMYGNDHLCRVFGLSSEKILRINPSDLYQNPDDRQVFLKHLSERGRVSGFEVKLKKSNGGLLWGALFSQKLTFKNEACVLTVIYDLTERRKTEDEIRQLKEELSQKATKYLIFTLDGAEYGIEILKVRKIVSMMPMTSLPDAPPYAAGMIRLGSSMIPVINLRLRLGLAAAESSTQTCIIVTESGDEKKAKMGFIVDSVIGVRGIKARDIESPSELNLEIDTELIFGIAKSDSGMKILIQPANIDL